MVGIMSKSSRRRGKGKNNRRAMRWVAHYHGEPIKVKSTGVVGWAMAGGNDLLKLFFGDGDRKIGDNCYYRHRDRIIEVSLAEATILRLKGDLPTSPVTTKLGRDFERLKEFLEKEKHG